MGISFASRRGENSLRRLQSNDEEVVGGQSHRRRMQEEETPVGTGRRRLLTSSHWAVGPNTNTFILDDVSVEYTTYSAWESAYTQEVCNSGLFEFEIEVKEFTNSGNIIDAEIGFASIN